MQAGRSTARGTNRNVVAVARIAPIPEGQPSAIRADVENNKMTVTEHRKSTRFSFEKVFDCTATQLDLFNYVGEDIVKGMLGGINGCALAYGQTGSGKTYTMLGGTDGNTAGIVPRFVQELLGGIATMKKDTPNSYELTLSIFEIYNEQVIDLLTQQNPNAQTQKVRPSLTSADITSVETFRRLANVAIMNRHTAATAMNMQSSRSHLVFELLLKETTPQTNYLAGKTSKVYLVDLAGSEQVNRSMVQGAAFAEATAINLSLTHLRSVFKALVKGRNHIPYRDSTLTWVLRDCIGGNSKTVMIATVSSGADNARETANTLTYATLAAKIVNCVKVNEDPTARRLRELAESLNSAKRNYDQAPNRDEAHDKQRIEELENERATLLAELERQAAQIAHGEVALNELKSQSAQGEEEYKRRVDELVQGEEEYKRQVDELQQERVEWLVGNFERRMEDWIVRDAVMWEAHVEYVELQRAFHATHEMLSVKQALQEAAQKKLDAVDKVNKLLEEAARKANDDSGLCQRGRKNDRKYHKDAAWESMQGHKYRGEALNGWAHGYGRCCFSDGRVYVGQWYEGRENGFGTLTTAKGDVYKGTWDHGRCAQLEDGLHNQSHPTHQRTHHDPSPTPSTVSTIVARASKQQAKECWCQ